MNNKKIFIALFGVLYFCVGLVSTIHAVSFFGLANAPLLGTILAITFEIGQAAVLFNLLTSPNQRKRFMPWALMCILTLVQILGNIFSSYKYLITNSSENLRYFKEPIFVWTDLPDNITTVIVTYIVGAILPVVALCLTEMVVSYLGADEEEKKLTLKEPEQNETAFTTNQSFINNEQTTESEQKQENNKQQEEVVIDSKENTEQEYKQDIKQEENELTVTDEIKDESNEVASDSDKIENNDEQVKEDEQKIISNEPETQADKVNKKSHFINI